MIKRNLEKVVSQGKNFALTTLVTGGLLLGGHRQARAAEYNILIIPERDVVVTGQQSYFDVGVSTSKKTLSTDFDMCINPSFIGLNEGEESILYGGFWNGFTLDPISHVNGLTDNYIIVDIGVHGLDGPAGTGSMARFPYTAGDNPGTATVGFSFAEFVDDSLTQYTNFNGGVTTQDTTFTIVPDIQPDFNKDGFVNMEDFNVFADNMGGPDAPPLQGRADTDLNGDGSVALDDFVQFQRCFTGEQPVTNPNCGD